MVVYNLGHLVDLVGSVSRYPDEGMRSALNESPHMGEVGWYRGSGKSRP